MTAYAELQVTTNFSFLRSGSSPQEMAVAAAAQGLNALAITDRNTLAGVVRGWEAAKAHALKLIVGARLDFLDAPSVLCLPTDRAAYGRLARLISLGRRRAPKGECHLQLADLLDHRGGHQVVALPVDQPDDDFAAHLARLHDVFGDDLSLAAHHHLRGDDEMRIERLAALGLPLVACNDVLYHGPARRRLQDVLTCVREHCTIDTAGFRLEANAERHLKSGAQMAELFARWPDAIGRSIEIAQRCHFSLSDLRYEYPLITLRPGTTAQEELEQRVQAGAIDRYRNGVPEKVEAVLEKELALIRQKELASYFLTVHDIVDFANREKILCQGRGSAANSAVCYCLGITAVDPAEHELLFARFLSEERDEPPDIDVDFEHERREEVIQYIYDTYGREHAGLAATVISYRPRSAIRDVGKALGLSDDIVTALAKGVWGWGSDGISELRVKEAGLDPDAPRIRLALELTAELLGFPRHLSQHVGGFVLSRGRLDELVPIENAAMDGRTVIEWDKDDLDAVGLFKVDVLALGMLSCLRKGFQLIGAHHGPKLELATVPQNDPETYAMIQRADTIGVFQIESRAQMTMLPRLKPANLYDLVIEVAIVRPGPIQGDMVHPYLRRRDGKEKVDYPSPALEKVLRKTLGIPLFQEQAMSIAIVGAGFTDAQADGLRRAMATFKRNGAIGKYEAMFVEGMVRNGYDRDFANRCFMQIQGFSDYGFPESHAASFAKLAYISAWMKCHYPDVFACALLNSQPMGFYAPAQIIRDARDHGVEVRPVDVNFSDWNCTIEEEGEKTALRLGLRQVKGLGEEDALALVEARGRGYATLRDAWRRSRLDPQALERLADADAWRSVGLDRRAALWEVRALKERPLPLFDHVELTARPGENALAPELAAEPVVDLPEMTMGEHVIEDYSSLSLSLKAHPLSLLRPTDDLAGCVHAASLVEMPHNTRVLVAGLVLVRQRPGTASGVVFVTLEDETGVANLVVWPGMLETYRREVMRSKLLVARGRVQREGIVVHVVIDRLTDRTDLLQALSPRFFHGIDQTVAHADEIRRPGYDRRTRVMPASRDFH